MKTMGKIILLQKCDKECPNFEEQPIPGTNIITELFGNIQLFLILIIILIGIYLVWQYFGSSDYKVRQMKKWHDYEWDEYFRNYAWEKRKRDPLRLETPYYGGGVTDTPVNHFPIGIYQIANINHPLYGKLVLIWVNKDGKTRMRINVGSSIVHWLEDHAAESDEEESDMTNFLDHYYRNSKKKKKKKKS